MKKLFGTDGIRGVAGQFPLDLTTVHAVGLALAHHLAPIAPDLAPRVIIGQDTRESSCWIDAALTAGLTAGRAMVESAGVITTPAVAFLARAHNCSRRHCHLRLAQSLGRQRHQALRPRRLQTPRLHRTRHRITRSSAASIATEPPQVSALRPPCRHRTLVNDADRAEYIRFLLAAVPGLSLDGRRIVIDCANGAASAIAPELFAELNAPWRRRPSSSPTPHPTAATSTSAAARSIPRSLPPRSSPNASMGITFDGDADRALFADESGKVVNGDAVLLLAARDLADRGLLTNSTVVATTMSNMGLEAALKRSHIKMLRAPVGDKYVLEQMLSTGAALGGEQSGHIIFQRPQHHRRRPAHRAAAARHRPPIRPHPRRTHRRPQDLPPGHRQRPRPREAPARPASPPSPPPSPPPRPRSPTPAASSSATPARGAEALARVMIEAESEPLMRHHANTIAFPPSAPN
jgi:phosphoglucosamine mutase